MPFGPTNGPATFINFIYDVDSQWKSLARTMGITIGDETNTRIIVDDIVSHGESLPISMLYMECQLRVALAYRLRSSHDDLNSSATMFALTGIGRRIQTPAPSVVAYS